ncbi:hypothetical protein AAHC03_024525 [Spirometra sp. Aus1]
MENKTGLLKTFSAGELNVLRPHIQQNSFIATSSSPSSSPLFGAKQTTRCSSASEITRNKPPAAGLHVPRYHRSRCRKSICSSGGPSNSSPLRVGSDTSHSSPPSTAFSPTWPMQLHSTGSESPPPFPPPPAPRTVRRELAAEESLANLRASDLGYCRLDEASCQEGPRIHVPSVRVGGTPPLLQCITKPTSLTPISATRRREFAAQFRDLFHPKQKLQQHDISGRTGLLVSWEDASRLFQTQFGISSSVALAIWKQMDSDGDLKLNESEYCLAASLAEKVASTGFNLLEANGLAHTHETENTMTRPFETSSLLDESRDLLLSPASASLLTPDVSEESDLVSRGGGDVRQPAMIRSEQPYESDSASLLSDYSFSRLAERGSLAYGVPLPAGQSTCPHSSPLALPNHISSNLEGLSGLAHAGNWTPSDAVIAPHKERFTHENEEDEAIGVAALLPTPGSQRGIVAKVNESLLIRSTSSGGGGGGDVAGNSVFSSHPSFQSASSSSSSASASSSLSSSPTSSLASSSLSRHARFLDYDHSHHLPSPSDSSSDSHHINSEDVDPIALLVGITGRDAELLRALPKCRRQRILTRMESLSKFINHTLLRLNNELAGELQELFDQQVWDDRQKDGICCTMKLDATEDSELVAINDIAVGSDAQGTLLAAVDNGCLVAFNIRRRRREMTSEPMGYSARAVITIKNNKKVLVGTDEGVVLTYNWNEFGSICDRFPVRTSRTRLSSSNLTKTFESGLPSVEKFSKINEDIVIIGTDDGALSAFNILPNRMISCLGWHTGSSEENFEQMGGDCMSLAVSPDAQFVASALPSSSNLRFWSLEGIESDAAREVDALKVPRKRRSSSALVSSKTSKSRATSREMDRKRCDFLSGLLPSDQESDESRDAEEDSDSDSDSSEDSGDS